MNTYIITCALTQPEKTYKSFFVALDKLGAQKVLPNGFFVRTDHDIEEMRVALLPYLNKPDGLIVASVSGEIAVRNAMCSPEKLKKILTEE